MKKISFCKECYSDDIIYVQEGMHVAMRCAKCNRWIRWANKEECNGKLIINKTNVKLL